jgi:hypothetical protein
VAFEWRFLKSDLTGTMAAILGVGSFTRRKALVLVVVFGSAYSDY